MKISKYFLMGAVAMSLFACSNDDEALNKKGENLTMIKLSLGKAETKALEQTAEGKFNNIKSLRVEFFALDGRNLYVDVPAADLATAVSDLNSKQNATLAVDNVPLMARRIAVIANEPKGTTIQTGNLNDAYKSEIKLSDMYDESAEPFGQKNSILTGAALFDGGTAGGKVEVGVEIKAVSSRIEIGKFTSTKIALPEGNTQTVVNIKDFYVEGIYMNQFHQVGTLDPANNLTVTDRQTVSNLSTPTNYTESHYNDGGYGFMCDQYDLGSATAPSYGIAPITAQAVTGTNGGWEVFPTVAEGEAKLYWSYPTLATVVQDGASQVPNIVVKLNVLYDNEGAKRQTRYLTITKYKTAGENGTAITKFDRNTAYRISNLTFNISDLTEVPYEGNKTVEATITVLAWDGIEIEPDWN